MIPPSSLLPGPFPPPFPFPHLLSFLALSLLPSLFLTSSPRRLLEQHQVAEMAMIPSKEAKEMLYSLLAENFVTLQVIIPPSFLLLLSERLTTSGQSVTSYFESGHHLCSHAHRRSLGLQTMLLPGHSTSSLSTCCTWQDCY